MPILLYQVPSRQSVSVSVCIHTDNALDPQRSAVLSSFSATMLIRRETMSLAQLPQVVLQSYSPLAATWKEAMILFTFLPRPAINCLARTLKHRDTTPFSWTDAVLCISTALVRSTAKPTNQV